MRLLTDMGVPTKLVLWLRERGHDATHLQDEGLQRLRNREIFGKVVAENRVILTFDLDFGEIAALSEGEKRSVVFRLRNTRTSHVIARQRERWVVIEETRHQIRRLPVGEGCVVRSGAPRVVLYTLTAVRYRRGERG